ncbi:unnamed protein product, partial [Rotaria sp. Silwood1]
PYWDSSELVDFFEKTPNLKIFSTSLDTYEEDDLPLFREFLPSPQNFSIKKLILTEVNSQRLMINLFKLLPNVNYLKIEIWSLNIDGYQWKEIIINYLPKLNVLQFMINSNLDDSIDNKTDEEKIDQYLETYRTPFWIEDHQWFIRCHWKRWKNNISIRVYSLPYAFNNFPICSNEFDFKTKSIYSSEMYFSYDSVRNVGYEQHIFSDEILQHVQLPNIEILFVRLPTDHRFFSIVSKFKNLHSLSISIPKIIYQSQLQVLLDNAPRLYSLAFESWKTSKPPPYQCTSKSIHRLDLHGSSRTSRKHHYTCKQCLELSRSSLGIQCQVLHIEVKELKCILQLIYSMINLRTLYVFYECDIRGNKIDLIKVLQDYLPSKWTVTRFCYGVFIIQS